jgi:acetyl esterase
MPLDPRAKRFLDRLAALNPPSVLALTVSERRTGLSQLLSFAGPGEPIASIEERSLTGPSGLPLTLRIYRPAVGQPTSGQPALAQPAPPPAPSGAAPPPDTPTTDPLCPALIYFHGGGLVAGTLDTHDPICRSLSNASGCMLLSVDYRLAPEYPFPAAIADGCYATEWVAGHAHELGIDPARIGVCGDSAGATLAAVVCQTVAASGQVRLALQFLLCPILDFCASTGSRRDFAAGYLVDQATLDHDLKHYLGADGDPTHPRVSPSRVADVSDLPPTCIHTAEFDPLRDEGAAYADRLQEAGVKTTYRCHSGMIHLFYGMGALIPYATTAYRQMGTDIRSMLGESER